MKKILAFLIAAILLLSLVACGSSAETTSADAEPAPEYSYGSAVSFYNPLGNGLNLADAQLDFDKSMWSISGYSDSDAVTGPFLSFDKSGAGKNLSKLVETYTSIVNTEDSHADPKLVPMLKSSNDAFSTLANMMVMPLGDYSTFTKQYDEAHAAFLAEYNALHDYLISVGAMAKE